MWENKICDGREFRFTYLADSASIFTMNAWSCTPAIGRAVIYVRLGSFTSQAVQNGTACISLPKLSFSRKPYGSRESQLSADHICLLFLPVIVTDRPPLTLTENLHPAAATVWSVYQAKGTFRFLRLSCESRKRFFSNLANRFSIRQRIDNFQTHVYQMCVTDILYIS